MKNGSKATLIGLSLVVLLTLAASASAQATIVEGTVISQMNVPIPGLTVFLAHPVVGRSFPAVTDLWGRFIFFNVPVRNDPYYLEIYWGYQLMYREAVRIRGPLRLPPILF